MSNNNIISLITASWLFRYKIYFWYFQEPVTIACRVGCDSNGKLNARSVIIEDVGQTSRCLPLDLTNISCYSLFPGQVIFIKVYTYTHTYLYTHMQIYLYILFFWPSPWSFQLLDIQFNIFDPYLGLTYQ